MHTQKKKVSIRNESGHGSTEKSHFAVISSHLPKQGLEERVWYPLECLHPGLLQSILQVPELAPLVLSQADEFSILDANKARSQKISFERI